MKEKLKNCYYVILVIVILVLGYFIVSNMNTSEVILEESEGVLVESVEESEEISGYYVDIKGEVVNPGVYELSTDSRVIDVINIAGGLTKNADTSIINLSKKISDEMNIRIYSKSEIKKLKENINKEPEVIEIIKEIEKECVCPEINDTCSSNDALIEDDKVNDKKEDIITDKIESSSKLININTASLEELMTLTGIGEVKAQAIINYRETYGSFPTIKSLTNVSGIGDKTLAKIADKITV